ncbi:hypothetical protein LOTGIDRAFT_166093 [Lottia gigantea]|uniref:FAD dependent oxidoreductase domain-containing protein n=1 Tax=Lottia gigantea TaxID=225164 RepID=V4A3A0_LOTGI|nr:hypothetical protein LOTGIDRAFT_166093 [Lottia gigantea]ESO87796.1 hypothetical protein LOTGIDRAFT_166093 [Lottia gigantea]
MINIAVIGAGIIGLSTAVNIQNRLPNATVTVIADKFEKDTTSYGAGGLIRPTYRHIKGDKVVLKRWCNASWEYFSGLSKGGRSSESGVFHLGGYVVSEQEQNDELCDSTVLNVRELSEEEKRRKGFNQAHSYFFSTLGISPPKYLTFLMKEFREKGGTVIFQTVVSLKEFVGKYDIVVTCCGLRAKELLNDDGIFPVQGHTVRVFAPWLKQWYMNTDTDTYLIPHKFTFNTSVIILSILSKFTFYTSVSLHLILRFNGEVVLGGCRKKGDYSLDIDEDLCNDIMRRCEELCPEIKGAKVVRNWVGLRPTREPVRIEKELKNFDGKKLKVVHNYGHGANGISLSWGTAVDAAQLVYDWANDMQFTSKL